MSEGGCIESCCGGICLFITSSLEAWCNTKAFSCGSQAGCCGGCFDKCFDNDDSYEKEVKEREAAKEADKHKDSAAPPEEPVTTQPTPVADPMVTTTGASAEMSIAPTQSFNPISVTTMSQPTTGTY